MEVVAVAFQIPAHGLSACLEFQPGTKAGVLFVYDLRANDELFVYGVRELALVGGVEVEPAAHHNPVTEPVAFAGDLFFRRLVELLDPVDEGLGDLFFQLRIGKIRQRPPRQDAAVNSAAFHFAVLGLTPEATLPEVKAAYRDKVKTHHPDSGGSVPEFLRLQEAYDRMWSEVMRDAAAWTVERLDDAGP